jgi:hypothetical protein
MRVSSLTRGQCAATYAAYRMNGIGQISIRALGASACLAYMIVMYAAVSLITKALIDILNDPYSSMMKYMHAMRKANVQRTVFFRKGRLD